MDEYEKEKIKMFVSDKVMMEAVKKVVLASYLKPQKDKDVQTLAASRIAIDLLQDAWRDLKKISLEEQGDIKKLKQIGL